MRLYLCALMLCVAGCGSFANLDKVVPQSAVIGSCEICMVVPQCSQCCHACAAEQCYDHCAKWPQDCDLCEEGAYWDCVRWNCGKQE